MLTSLLSTSRSKFILTLLLAGFLAACGGGNDTATAGDGAGNGSGSAGGGSGSDGSGNSGSGTGDDNSGGTSGSGDGSNDVGNGSSDDPVGGGGNSGGGVGSAMRITVYDDPVARNPVSGVSVSLYNTDDKTIAQTILTGNDGVADFGVIASSMTSLKSTPGHRGVTIAEPQSDGGYEITSLLNLKAGSYPWYVGGTAPTGCEQVGTIASGTFTGMTNSSNAIIWPLFGSSGLTGTTGIAAGQVIGGTLQVTNVPVCSSHLQPDGTLALLVQGGDQANQLTTYGYIANLPVSDAMQVNGDASTAYGTLNWTATSAHVPSQVATSQFVNSVFFPQVSSNTNGATSGSIAVADQLPAGVFSVSGISTGVDGAMSCSASTVYNSTPGSAVITMPDYGTVGVSYDASSAKIGVSRPGSTVPDVQLTSLSVSQPNIGWTLIGDGLADMTQVPDLPATIQVGTIDPSASTLSLIDFSGVSGFDAATGFYLQVNGGSANFDTRRVTNSTCVYPLAPGAGNGSSGGGGDTGGDAGGGTGDGGSSGGGSGASGQYGSLAVSGSTQLASSYEATSANVQEVGGMIGSITWTDAGSNDLAVIVGNPDTSTAALVSLTFADNSALIATPLPDPLPVTIDYANRRVVFDSVSVEGVVVSGELSF